MVVADKLAQELLVVFDRRVLSYQEQLARCQQACTEDAVHDLRVSIRRLLALLDLLQVVAPGLRRRKKLPRRLKRQLAGLGSLRDVQVMLAAVQAIDKPLEGKQPFTVHLLKREQLCLEDARRQLEQFPVDKVLRRLRKTRAQLEKLAAEIQWRHALLTAVDEAFATVLSRHMRARRGDLASIHRVRIAFKYFRYTVEIVQLLLPAYPASAMREMRRYQTLLGNIQDIEVMQAELAGFAATAEAGDTESLQRYVRRRHARLLARYWQSRERLTGLRLPANGAGGV